MSNIVLNIEISSRYFHVKNLVNLLIYTYKGIGYIGIKFETIFYLNISLKWHTESLLGQIIN